LVAIAVRWFANAKLKMRATEMAACGIHGEDLGRKMGFLYKTWVLDPERSKRMLSMTRKKKNNNSPIPVRNWQASYMDAGCQWQIFLEV
jgi:hypothetical protein